MKKLVLQNSKNYLFSILKTLKYFLKKLEKKRKRIKVTKIINKIFKKGLFFLLKLTQPIFLVEILEIEIKTVD